MVCEEEVLLGKVWDLYEQISRLESLKPSKDVDMLFTQLVLTCMPPTPGLDLSNLSQTLQEMRSKLIRLCGEAEALLEIHFSSILASFTNPLDHLNLFPYYSNYLKLSLLEFNILKTHFSSHHHHFPSTIAFVGSGPLPLTSIVLASNHLKSTTFHNFDIDPLANSMAFCLISSHPDLSNRMFFHTADVLNVTDALKDFEVVFLAALVGLDKEEKLKILNHLSRFMAPGAYLMLRSAHGARAFLYPVVDVCDLSGSGFQVLSVFHPTDEVINSVVIARKVFDLLPVGTNFIHDDDDNDNNNDIHIDNNNDDDDDDDDDDEEEEEEEKDGVLNPIILANKCSGFQTFNPMIEEFAMEEQLS